MESKKVNPQFFFVSLGVLVTLIMSVTAFLHLVFQILDHVFPDVLTDTYQYGYVLSSSAGIRTSLALLIIIFPLYLVCEYLRIRIGKRGLTHADEVLQRWALYLIVFLTSTTIIASLVTLVQYFVSGEITTRFILKVFATLAIASMVGWYYVRILTGKKVRGKMLVLLASVIVLAGIIWSFMVIGSPISQRQQRLDQRRIDDLQSIQWQVISYWQQKQVLPTSLSELQNPLSGAIVPQDPEFQKGKTYEYGVDGVRAFHLCATFTLPMPVGYIPGNSGEPYPLKDRVAVPAPIGGTSAYSWDHQSGRTCYQRTIDPDLYPPFPKK
jgi:hypothetical protein